MKYGNPPLITNTPIQVEKVAVFKSLTLSEQYVSLLDCFWLKADWRELQVGRYHREPYSIEFLFSYLELSQLPYDYGYFLLYFSYFGFWQVVLDEEVRKENHYRVKSIELQPLFKQ